MAAFLLDHEGVAPADALYVFFIGGNDVRAARDVSRREARLIIKKAVGAITVHLQTLLGAGARHVMVINSADIGRIPETAYVAELEGSSADLLRWRGTLRTRLFNILLNRAVGAVEEDTGVPIALFDFFRFMNQAVANAPALGFINSQDACLNLETGMFHPDCGLAKFDQFFMFDLLHPSAHAHARAGLGLAAMAPKPLPE